MSRQHESRQQRATRLRGDVRALQRALRELPAHAPERAALVARARELIGAAWETGDLDLWRETVAAFRDAYVTWYPPGFDEARERLRCGDASGLEVVLRFLEADPYFFRSGYLKGDLIRCILRLDLSQSDAQRLCSVVLRVVDTANHYEFRWYRRLARKVDSPPLRRGLAERLDGRDPDARRRARWVLEALDQPMDARYSSRSRS
jgi:hypothetical protein